MLAHGLSRFWSLDAGLFSVDGWWLVVGGLRIALGFKRVAGSYSITIKRWVLNSLPSWLICNKYTPVLKSFRS